MKVGDKVRFLDAVGGGVITAIQDKNTILVQDDDGFDIPVLAKDVVVIETDDYNIAKVHTVTPKKGAKANEDQAFTSVKKALSVDDTEDEDEEVDIADKELTYKPMAQERRGANELNVFLAFVPVNIKNVGDTAIEAYIVNDCNYYVNFSLMTYEGKACHLRHSGELAPNTKLFLEEFERSELEVWERITIQTIAYKREKSFLLKPAMSVGLRIEGPKFYKLHTFQPSSFFTSPALIFDVIKNDKPARTMFVDADEIREAMQTPQDRALEMPARVQGAERRAQKKADRNSIIEIDLHAAELFDTMVGLEPKDILEYQLKVFNDTMQQHQKERGRRIVFIHGKGDGVLRNAILKELKARYKQCSYQDASFREYGYGATMVTL